MTEDRVVSDVDVIELMDLASTKNIVTEVTP